MLAALEQLGKTQTFLVQADKLTWIVPVRWFNTNADLSQSLKWNFSPPRVIA